MDYLGCCGKIGSAFWPPFREELRPASVSNDGIKLIEHAERELNDSARWIGAAFAPAADGDMHSECVAWIDWLFHAPGEAEKGEGAIVKHAGAGHQPLRDAEHQRSMGDDVVAAALL